MIKARGQQKEWKAIQRKQKDQKASHGVMKQEEVPGRNLEGREQICGGLKKRKAKSKVKRKATQDIVTESGKEQINMKITSGKATDKAHRACIACRPAA
jgi:hypothetical protein